MIHPATELRLVDPVVGHGVYATAAIPRGTIVWALDPLDRLLTQAEIDFLPAPVDLDMERHLWRRPDGLFVLAWDLARFVNHSCAPNCVTTPQGCEIAIVDIAAGEQLTNDYAALGMIAGERLHCGCRTAQCRQIVAAEQERAVRAGLAGPVARALERAPQVAQPLAGLLPPTLRERILHIGGTVRELRPAGGAAASARHADSSTATHSSASSPRG